MHDNDPVVVVEFSNATEARLLNIPRIQYCNREFRMFPGSLYCSNLLRFSNYNCNVSFGKIAGGPSELSTVAQTPVNGLFTSWESAKDTEMWRLFTDHIQSKHRKSAAVSMKCMKCAKSFPDLEQLWEHSFQLPEIGFFCLICRFPFPYCATKPLPSHFYNHHRDLVVHKRSVLSTSQYLNWMAKAGSNNESTSTTSDRDKHSDSEIVADTSSSSMLTLGGALPAFKTNNYYKHASSGGGFECLKCSKKYSHVQEVKRHIRNSHVERRCRTCSAAFFTYCKLATHQRKCAAGYLDLKKAYNPDKTAKNNFRMALCGNKRKMLDYSEFDCKTANAALSVDEIKIEPFDLYSCASKTSNDDEADVKGKPIDSHSVMPGTINHVMGSIKLEPCGDSHCAPFEKQTHADTSEPHPCMSETSPVTTEPIELHSCALSNHHARGEFAIERNDLHPSASRRPTAPVAMGSVKIEPILTHHGMTKASTTHPIGAVKTETIDSQCDVVVIKTEPSDVQPGADPDAGAGLIELIDCIPVAPIVATKDAGETAVKVEQIDLHTTGASGTPTAHLAGAVKREPLDFNPGASKTSTSHILGSVEHIELINAHLATP